MQVKGETVHHANMDEQDHLALEFKDFCLRQNLRVDSAEDMLQRDDLTTYQKEYLTYFLVRWESASER